MAIGAVQSSPVLSLPISLSGTANGHSGGLRGNYSGP